ncbi:MAG: glycoside hydrolase family 38 C-terminal domain-containing protein [Mycoplasmatales bacterium]
MKYKAHIISHSHWDREWYLPYEQHHVRLINLIDEILEEIEHNPKFGSFNLDGQTIIVADYLSVKPQNKERLLQAIKKGKLKIGPWYILQDAYLTSSEANVRNLQVGHHDAQVYGKKTKIGYFPDTFGIYAQAPQLLQQADINNMFFGRGVTPTGFNNQVAGAFDSKFSEMLIKAPNGTKALGILFANWYSNANEIPNNKELAKTYWDQKITDVKKFTKNKNLLFMNGCDHTPMQPDITQAIDLANTLYEDVEFIHSSLEDYLIAIQEELNEAELSVIDQELRSQDTDGYYTLVNTLSARIYQKQQNFKVQNMYEQLVEPLATMTLDKAKYPHDKITYGWKKLMQNHPHDSICGCSCDEVHAGMDTRFMRAKNVALGIIDEVLYNYRENVQKEDNQKEFTVFNPTTTNKEEVIEVIIDYDKEYFGTDFNQNRKNLENKQVPNLNLIDKNGQKVEVIIEDLGVHFGYDLPKDKFRRSFYARKLRLQFKAVIPRFTWTSYILEENPLAVDKTKIEQVEVQEEFTQSILENNKLKLEVTKPGIINLYHKELDIYYPNILEIIDEGDLGNEYMFGSVANDKVRKINKITKIESSKNSLYQINKVYTSITLPLAAQDTLVEEKRKLVEYYQRETKRTEEMLEVPLLLTIKLANDSNKLDIKLNFENKCQDHRMRFKFNLQTAPVEVEADGIFEVTKRKTKVSKNWQNPHNDQPMQKFLGITEQNHNLIIGTEGLHEYEVKDQELYITFLRSVSELGDWGDFPTPKAQCLQEIEVNISLIVDKLANKYQNYNKLRTNFIPLPYTMIYQNQGKLPKNKEFLKIMTDDNAYISSLKRNRAQEACLRLYSNGLQAKFNIQAEYQMCNLLEETLDNNEVQANEIEACEIRTLKINNK